MYVVRTAQFNATMAPNGCMQVWSGLLLRVDVEGTPVMRTWHIVHLQSKVLSPAAEAFRYFVLERGEPLLVEHDTPLLRPAG